MTAKPRRLSFDWPFLKVSGHVSVFLPRATEQHWFTQLIWFLWMKNGWDLIWTPGEKKWWAHVFLGKMENSCWEETVKNIILKWSHLFHSKGKESLLLKVTSFFFYLPHWEKVVLNCFHGSCFEIISAFIHNSQPVPSFIHDFDNLCLLFFFPSSIWLVFVNFLNISKDPIFGITHFFYFHSNLHFFPISVGFAI